MYERKYNEEEIKENDVISCLEMAGLHYQNKQRYIISQCPLHQDRSPSAQIYKDDWFVLCHSGCGRFHITKAYPTLRDRIPLHHQHQRTPTPNRRTERAVKVKYKKYNQYDYWKTLPLIPRDHQFKTIPLEILDRMGWRWLEAENSYYIPYFNMYENQVPFSQLRHLDGKRRFTFLTGARILTYGLWNLDPSNSPVFLVEGTSDCAVMEYCGVPYVGTPSANQEKLIQGLGKYCKDNGIHLVYAGDNDVAGDAVRNDLDKVVTYRVHQPPKEFKDWGDFLVARGFDEVYNYIWKFINPTIELNDGLEVVRQVFGDIEQLDVVFTGEKEQTPMNTTLL